MELVLDQFGALNADSFYKPLPKQDLLHTSPAKNLLGIGGNFSGKSLFLIGEAMYNVLEYPGANVLLLRRDYPELEKGLILDFKNTVPKELYKWNDQKHIARFHNGSLLFFGHLKSGHEKDLAEYLSAAFVFVGIDELGQFSYSAWDFLSSRNRVNKGCQANTDGLMPYCRMGAATNPMGPGYGWIKRLWIEHKPVTQLGDVKQIKGKYFGRVTDRGMLQNPEFLKRVVWMDAEPWICVYDPADYFYVHSTILDNPFAAQRDPDAISKLMKLAPALRQKALYGDLESVAGAYFQNFTYDRHILSLETGRERIQFQSWQPIWISIDWGLAHYSSVHWHTRAQILGVDGKTWTNRVVTYRELVINETSIGDLTQMIADQTPDTDQEYFLGFPERERVKFIFLSPERFNRTHDTQHTIADQMGEDLKALGLPRPSRANDRREDGAVFMYNLLDADEVIILDTCPQAIESLETRERNTPDHPEDVRKVDDVGDDVYDDLRYGYLSMLSPKHKPADLKLQEKLASIPDFTSRMVYAFVQQNKAEEAKKPIKTKIVPRWMKNR
jgi:hypothetical protein